MAILRGKTEKFEDGCEFPDIAKTIGNGQLTTENRVTMFEGLLIEACLV